MKGRRALLTFAALALIGTIAAYNRAQAADDPATPAKLPSKSKYKRSRLTNDESEVTADKRRLLLTTGEDKAVDLDFEANAGANGISIGNPQVVATTLARIGDKRQIVFKPLKAGETTVTIRDQDGTIRLIFTVRVTGSNLLRIKGEITNLLSDIEGLQTKIVGPKVILDGEILVPADYGRLLAVIQDKAYADFVLNLATLSPLAMQVLSRKIQEDITSFAPNVRTRVVNGMIFLEGTVDNDEQARRSAKVATLYMPDLRPGAQIERDASVQRLPPRSLIQNFIVVNPPPPKKAEKLVRVTFHFVQLDKDYNKLFGFKWEPGFTADPTISIGTTPSGTTGASTGGASFSATISSLLPKLQSAQKAGYARVLKTATIVVRSGQPASLAEQVQIPFLTSGPNGQVQAGKDSAGLNIAVTPLVLGQSEDIQMDLKMVQSDPTGRLPAGGTTISERRVETKIYVKSNESAAIAGVTSTVAGTQFNKDDPSSGTFDQSNPTDPLFTLLRSKNYSKKKSQFVVFVTPQIVDNASEGTEDLKKNFRIRVK